MDYAYNAAGQLTAVDYGGAVSSFTYNYAGMKTSMNDADMGLWQYSYNARGMLSAQTDPAAAPPAWAMTPGRVLSKSYAEAAGSTTQAVDYIMMGFICQALRAGAAGPRVGRVSGNASVTGGVLQVTGNGSVEHLDAMPAAGREITDGTVVRFAFKTSDVTRHYGAVPAQRDLRYIQRLPALGGVRDGRRAAAGLLPGYHASVKNLFSRERQYLV